MAPRFSSKAVKIVAPLIAVLVMGFLVSYFRLFSAEVAPAFRDARNQGALISDSIVGLSNDISTDLAKVNEYDKNGQSREALDLTTVLHLRVQQVKQQANELSEQLKSMITGLDSIQSQDAKQAAMEAITDRMALISRLLSYGQYLDQLTDVLSNHFAGVPDKASVQIIISQINAEVTAVNSFNKQAVQAMQRFDERLK